MSQASLITYDDAAVATFAPDAGDAAPDGGLDAGYEAIRSRTRDVIQDVLRAAGEDGASITVSRAIASHIGRSLLIGLMIPTEYGGLGQDCVARLVCIEESARLSPGIGAFLQIAQLGTMALIEFGSHDQRALWLPELATGQRICTIAITEEHS